MTSADWRHMAFWHGAQGFHAEAALYYQFAIDAYPPQAPGRMGVVIRDTLREHDLEVLAEHVRIHTQCAKHAAEESFRNKTI